MTQYCVVVDMIQIGYELQQYHDMICLLFYYIFKTYSSCITTSNECYPTQKYNHVMEQKQKPQARFGINIWLYFCAVARWQSRSDLRGRGGHDNDNILVSIFICSIYYLGLVPSCRLYAPSYHLKYHVLHFPIL